MYAVIKSKAIISDSSADVDDESPRTSLGSFVANDISVFLIELWRNKNVICDTQSKIVDRAARFVLTRHIVSDGDGGGGDVIEF